MTDSPQDAIVAAFEHGHESGEAGEQLSVALANYLTTIPAEAQSGDGTGPTVHEANDLLRQLNVEVFNDGIDIAKLPYAVGLVLDFAKLAGAVSPEQGKPPCVNKMVTNGNLIHYWRDPETQMYVAEFLPMLESAPTANDAIERLKMCVLAQAKMFAGETPVPDGGAASSQGATSERGTCDTTMELCVGEHDGTIPHKHGNTCGNWRVAQSVPEPPTDCSACEKEARREWTEPGEHTCFRNEIGASPEQGKKEKSND